MPSILFTNTVTGPYPSSFLTGALSDLKTIYEVPGRPMIGFDRVREKYGDFVLLRGGLVIPDILLMSDPAVSVQFQIIQIAHQNL